MTIHTSTSTTTTTAAPTLDRRTQRTRSALRDALVLLIAERGWDEIAVQDVCARANVGRSTFYSHYPSKDALLVGGFEDLQAALQAQARTPTRASVGAGAGAAAGVAAGMGMGMGMGMGTNTNTNKNVGVGAGQASADPAAGFGFAMGLIEHAYEQRQLFRGLIGRRSGYAVQQRFREMVLRLVTDELPPTVGALPREAVARWLSAAFVELLSWWVEQPTLLPPTQIAAWFTELAQPALQAGAAQSLAQDARRQRRT